MPPTIYFDDACPSESYSAAGLLLTDFPATLGGNKIEFPVKMSDVMHPDAHPMKIENGLMPTILGQDDDNDTLMGSVRRGSLSSPGRVKSVSNTLCEEMISDRGDFIYSPRFKMLAHSEF